MPKRSEKPRRLDEPKRTDPAQRFDNDKRYMPSSLFYKDFRDLAESIGLDWWAAKKLYDDKWLSFDPEINTIDSSSKEAELIFLGSFLHVAPVCSGNMPISPKKRKKCLSWNIVRPCCQYRYDKL